MEIKIEPLDDGSPPQECDTPHTFKIEPVDVPCEEFNDLRDSSERVKVEETEVEEEKLADNKLSESSEGISLKPLPLAGTSEYPKWRLDLHGTRDTTIGGGVDKEDSSDSEQDDPDWSPNMETRTSPTFSEVSEDSEADESAEAKSPTDRAEERSKIIEQLRTKMDLSDPSTLKYSDGSKFHLCLICGYKANYSYRLTNHVRTHTGEKRYACSQCDFRSVEAGGLILHMRKHSGEKPFACPHCDYRGRSQSCLKRHVRVHTGEKPFACPQCDFRVSSHTSLKRHLRIHTGEKPYACQFCDYRSIGLISLKRHLRYHTGEKRHVCSICRSEFPTYTCLKLHMRTHTGEKPIPCEYDDFRDVSLGGKFQTEENPYLYSQCDSSVHIKQERLEDFVKAPRRTRLAPGCRWSKEETALLLEQVRKAGGDQFEKPTAQLYYRKIIDAEPALARVSWMNGRDKMRNLKIKYKAAIDWRSNTGAELADRDEEKSIRAYTLKLCPQFDILDETFGVRPSINPLCIPLESAVSEHDYAQRVDLVRKVIKTRGNMNLRHFPEFPLRTSANRDHLRTTNSSTSPALATYRVDPAAPSSSSVQAYQELALKLPNSISHLEEMSRSET